MSKDTGEQAFSSPRTTPHSSLVNDASQGMTLRDWLAGQSLHYIGIVQGISMRNGNGIESKEIAEMCYEIADAMIAERGRDE